MEFNLPMDTLSSSQCIQGTGAPASSSIGDIHGVATGFRTQQGTCMDMGGSGLQRWFFHAQIALSIPSLYSLPHPIVMLDPRLSNALKKLAAVHSSGNPVSPSCTQKLVYVFTAPRAVRAPNEGSRPPRGCTPTLSCRPPCACHIR